MAAAVVETAIIMGLILLLAKLGEDFASRAGFPAFVGAILAGVALGPAGLGVVKEKELENLALLLSIGINFTLFLAGVEELSNPRLFKPGLRELAASAILLSSSGLAAYYYTHVLWGLTPSAAAAFSMAVSMVSLGPLMKALMETGESLRGPALSILRVGLIVELVAILLFNSVFKQPSVTLFLETIAFVALVLFLGQRLLSKFFYAIERYVAAREAPFAIIVALILMAGYIAEALGFNAAVTALLLGAFTADYLGRRPAYMERIRAFTYGFLEPLFFAGVGLYAARPGIGSATAAAVLLAALAVSRLAVAPVLGVRPSRAMLLMAKGGVDAAMLVTLAQAEMIDSQIYTAGLAALLASTITVAAGARGRGAAPELWRKRIAEIPLDHVTVYHTESAAYAARIAAEHNAVVVVDEQYRPVGYIVAEDLVELDPHLLEKLPAIIFSRPEIPVVDKNTTVAELVSNPSIVHEPIIAVVDENGKVVGTITPRKLLNLLLGEGAREH